MYLAAFLTALPIGMGVGGAGLFILFLTVFKNVAQLEAQLLNLLFYLSASLGALLLNVKNRLIPGKLFFFLTPFAFLGAYIGSICAFNCPKNILSLLFSFFMILSGSYSLFKK